MEDKITIIEGPPPVFEKVNDGWALGLNESPWLYDLTLTQVRTFNGPALVERCHRVWKEGMTMYLHYRDEMGIEEKAPILAARSVDSEDGQVLLLWTRQLPEVDENELDEGDDLDDEDEDDDEEEDDDEKDDDQDNSEVG